MPVFRSVALDASPAAANAPHHFDPLGGFDSFAPHATAGHHKELGSLNPKHAYTYAPFTPQPLSISGVDAGLAMPSLAMPSLSPQREMPQAPPAPAPAVQSESLSQQSTAASLPPLTPMWLEPNSHFFCCCAPPASAAALFATVESALRAMHDAPLDCPQPSPRTAVCTLDCTPLPDRFKLSCTAYQSVSGCSTPFVVRIFRCADDSTRFCVEFQRRQGDVMAFYSIFRSARDIVLAKHGQAAPNSAPAALAMPSLPSGLAPPKLQLRSWSAPPLPTEAGSVNKESMCDTVRSLLAMCASPCCDVKQSAVQALAEWSSAATDVHDVLVSEGVHHALLACVGLQHADLPRASIMALANLCETRALGVCDQVVRNEAAFGALLALCDANSAASQQLRELARLLRACAASLGSQLLSALAPHHQPRFRQAVERLKAHPDAKCRMEADHIERCIIGAY